MTVFKAIAFTALLAMAVPLSQTAAAAGASEDASPQAAADPTWTKARQAVVGNDFEAAIPLLLQVVKKNPKSADAFNYLGYAHSRTGKVDEAKGYYAKALALNPEHRGANEYLGELYLKLGDLPAAEQRLAVLDKACFFGCEEFYTLRDAIKEFKSSGKFMSRKKP